MKNIHWMTLGVAHVLLYVILGIHFAPNLNTGLAIDAYKYISALGWFALSPILFYWYICSEPVKRLNKSSYGLNVGSIILFVALILNALIFLFYKSYIDVSSINDKFDFQDFVIANLTVCFLVIVLFSALSKISGVSDEITSNHELNISRKHNLKIQIEDLKDQLARKTNQNSKVVRIFEKILDELVYLPSQVPMNQYTIFNQKTSEFVDFSNLIFQDYATGSFDSDSKIEEFSYKADALIRLFSNFKNTK